jgi:RecA-family ATPase
MKLSHQDTERVKHLSGYGRFAAKQKNATANDDDPFNRDEQFFDWYHAELGKADRGEPAMVRREKDVIYHGRANSNVVLLVPQWVPPTAVKPNGKATITAHEEMLLDYLQRGWDLMRLQPRSKEPYEEDKWSAPHKPYAITSGNIDQVLAKNENTGLIFSTAGRVKDLDFDYQESADLADIVGLEGAAFGRGSVIGHRLFDAPGCEAKKFELPKLPAGSYPRELPLHDGKPSRIVMEIRGNDRTYTMIPPSMHPCGEPLVWVGKRDLAKVTAKELRALAGRHAFASVVLYFYPTDDATACYDTRMALTGALVRSGMSTDLVTRYVQGVARLAGDPKWEEDFAERTKKLLQEGKKVTGLTKLIKELALPSKCLDVFYEWLNVADDEAEKAEEPLPVLRSYYLEELQQQPVIPAKWIAEQFILAYRLNGFFGDGGVGKDYVMLQLAIAMASSNGQWLGMEVMHGRVMYFPVEDEDDDVRWREDGITRFYKSEGTYHPVLKQLKIVPLEDDTVLAAYNHKSGRVEPTPLFTSVCQMIEEFKPLLVILGNRANIFGVNQNDDAQARQCMHLLRNICRKYKTTVLLLGHVSVGGKEKGVSGTVQWSNACRHRCYLRRVEEENGEEGDPNLREIEVMKTNHAATGELLTIRWLEGLFVNTGVVRVKEQQDDAQTMLIEDENEFLRMLDGVFKGDIVTTKSKSPYSFQKKFLKGRFRGRNGLVRLEDAARRLFDKGVLDVVPYGAPSDDMTRIVRKK